MPDVQTPVRNTTTSPTRRLLSGFGRRNTALDYAFFKLNLPEQNVALLVDFIIRRRQHIAQVRVSVHAPEGSGVYLAEQPLERLAVGSSSSDDRVVSLGESWLGGMGSRGAVEPVTWDLTFHPTGPLVSPLIGMAGPFFPFDLFLQTVPAVRFSGTITIVGQTYDVPDAHGMVSSYAGRALPMRWFWLSCNTFDRENLAVECLVSHPALFGSPLRLRAGYFYVSTADRTELIVAPLTGSIRLAGTREAITITARRFGGARYVLRGKAAPQDFHNLGDRIWNTLLGSCILEGYGTACGSAALEERTLPVDEPSLDRL
jgi:hypothetical protein